MIAQAQATVVSAKAEMAFAEHELNRYNHLAGVGAGTVQNAQQARTRIDQATARLANVDGGAGGGTQAGGNPHRPA